MGQIMQSQPKDKDPVVMMIRLGLDKGQEFTITMPSFISREDAKKILDVILERIEK